MLIGLTIVLIVLPELTLFLPRLLGFASTG
jgi:hypothetical protein